MAVLSFTPSLVAEYRRLFATCTIRPEHELEVEQAAFQVLMLKGRYEALTEPLKIPWVFVALIHKMEADCDFTRHLYNGDPLTARTIHVPCGMPREGEPPFTWEQSAIGALKHRLGRLWSNWGLSELLYSLEKWNGFGYRSWHPETLSPYLWSFSNHYSRGRYDKDGIFDKNEDCHECGAAVILRQLVDGGSVEFKQQES